MKKTLVLLSLLILTIGLQAAIPCVLIRWDETRTNYTVVNYSYNPEFLPIDGLIPELEALVKREPYSIPVYDSRLKILGVQNTISETFDAQYPTSRQWITTYTLIDRSILDKQISVDEAENDANYQVFPTSKQFKYMVLALAIIDRKASGLTITAAQQRILDKLQAKALKIWNNHITGLAKKAELEAGYDVDLDSDFEVIDPENE